MQKDFRDEIIKTIQWRRNDENFGKIEYSLKKMLEYSKQEINKVKKDSEDKSAIDQLIIKNKDEEIKTLNSDAKQFKQMSDAQLHQSRQEIDRLNKQLQNTQTQLNEKLELKIKENNDKKMESLKVLDEISKNSKIQNLTNETFSSILKIIDIFDNINSEYLFKIDLSGKEEYLFILRILSRFTLPQLNSVVLNLANNDQNQDIINMLTNSFTQNAFQNLEIITNPNNPAKIDISVFIPSISTCALNFKNTFLFDGFKVSQDNLIALINNFNFGSTLTLRNCEIGEISDSFALLDNENPTLKEITFVNCVNMDANKEIHIKNAISRVKLINCNCTTTIK